MIAKVAFFLTALAAAHATALLAPAVYGHGLAIKAPAAPILTAPLLSKPVITAPAAPILTAPLLHAPLLNKHVISAPALSVQRSVVTTHHAAPVAYAAPLQYGYAKAAPVAYAAPLPYGIAKTAPLAPVLSHTGFLGAAPLAYTGLLGHGLAYSGHPLAYGHGLYAPKLGYSKLIL